MIASRLRDRAETTAAGARARGDDVEVSYLRVRRVS